MKKSVLALDLATTFGWCEGVPGEKPIFGEQRFAPAGADSSAVFAGAIKWVAERCSAFKPSILIYEAPLDPRHLGPKTTRDTALRLIGLPACVEGTAYLSGVYDIREARADDVRSFLLGTRPKKADAKRMVMDRLKLLGHEVKGDNEADALAIWLYASALIDPKAGIQTAPLFESRKPAPAAKTMWDAF